MDSPGYVDYIKCDTCGCLVPGRAVTTADGKAACADTAWCSRAKEHNSRIKKPNGTFAIHIANSNNKNLCNFSWQGHTVGGKCRACDGYHVSATCELCKYEESMASTEREELP